jgi:hypothetical protein
MTTALLPHTSPHFLIVAKDRSCACGKVEATANTTGIASRAKVFWFFSSEKNCFVKSLFLLTYFSGSDRSRAAEGLRLTHISHIEQGRFLLWPLP